MAKGAKVFGKPGGVVKVKVKGGRTQKKFPIKSPAQARNAMARLNQAKPALSSAQKQSVARAARATLGHTTPAIKRVLGGSKGKK
jgi:hypothetical protein